MSAAQLQREFCETCRETTLHRVLVCIHCGTVRTLTKNQVEWNDDHTPKVWNLKRRLTKAQTFGERMRAKAARRRAARLRELAKCPPVSQQ